MVKKKILWLTTHNPYVKNFISAMTPHVLRLKVDVEVMLAAIVNFIFRGIDAIACVFFMFATALRMLFGSFYHAGLISAAFTKERVKELHKDTKDVVVIPLMLKWGDILLSFKHMFLEAMYEDGGKRVKRKLK